MHQALHGRADPDPDANTTAHRGQDRVRSDPFCIIMVLNFGIGVCTPPVGISLLVGCGIGGVNIEQSINKSLLSIYLVMVLVLGLVTFFPVLSLGLLELMK